MANVVANIARGSFKYYYYMVENGLTLASAGQFTVSAGAAIGVLALFSSGLEADATIVDYDDVAAMLAGASNEATNVNYARKILVAADLAAVPAPDDTNNRWEATLPVLTWTSIGAAAGAWGKLCIYFRPATASADSACIPIMYQDFAVTPDGNNIVGTPDAAGVYRSA
jgi:hypothetical protein